MAGSDASSPAPLDPSGDDWPAQAADTIVRVVGRVRETTTGRAITAGRAVVFGTLAGILGLVALVVLCILLVRGTVVVADLLLGLGDLDRPGRAVWIAHLFVGLVFALAGAFLWNRAIRTPEV